MVFWSSARGKSVAVRDRETARIRHAKDCPSPSERMVSALEFVGLLVVVGVNTAVAAVVTRFLRIRMKTRWGRVVYVALVVPTLVFVSTLALSGVLGLGTALGDRATAILAAFVLPLVLGFSVDLFWMPHPDDVELPDTTDDAGSDPDRGSAE